MIQSFYYRFLHLTHSERLSVFLAYLARFVFFLRFLLKRLALKHRFVNMTETEALSLLREKSPEPTMKPDYSMTELDGNCDLSIIVPVYNHVDVLEKCIDSIINQRTGYAYELILIDDGSTDGAQDLVEKYRTLDFVRVFHQKNGGIAGARNAGIEKSRGRYIMFVDCDDYVHDDLIDCLMARAEQDDADIVMCAHALVKVKNGVIISRIPFVESSKNLLGYKNGDWIMNYAGLPWGKVYKRRLFEKVRFFPGYWYEDTIIHSLIFTQCTSFVYIPEVKYEYQWYEGNFSHTQGGKGQIKAIDRYWLLKAIVERYEELGLKQDAVFYTMLLKHVSAYYYPTIASLPENVVQAMFIAGRELLLKHKPKEKVKLPYMLRLTERAIINNDIALWELCSVNQ